MFSSQTPNADLSTLVQLRSATKNASNFSIWIITSINQIIRFSSGADFLYLSLLGTGLYLLSLIRLFHYRKRQLWFTTFIRRRDDSVTLLPGKFSAEDYFVTLSIYHFPSRRENTGSNCTVTYNIQHCCRIFNSNPDRFSDSQFAVSNATITGWLGLTKKNGTDLRLARHTSIKRSTGDFSNNLVTTLGNGKLQTTINHLVIKSSIPFLNGPRFCTNSTG